MNAVLPGPRYHTSAVWTETHAYIFDGRNNTSVVDDIIIYEPSSDSVSVEDAKLPTARERTSAVWVGDYAIVFGGQAGAEYSDQILKFDPEGDDGVQPDEPFLVYQLMGIVAIMLVLIWVVGRRKKE